MKFYTITQFPEYNTVITKKCLPINDKEQFGEITVRARSEQGADGLTKTCAVFSVQKTLKKKTAVKVVFEQNDWDTANYVFAPAALYNGNRFYSLCKSYPPMLTKEEAHNLKGKTVLTDVPRLPQSGGGCVQLSVGDLSCPCMGYYAPKSQTGYLLFFQQSNELGDFGISIQEAPSGKKASFILSSPCLRLPYKYGMCTTQEKSDDSGVILKAGSTITFSFTEAQFKCRSVNEFLNVFFDYRQKHSLPRTHPQGVPWYHAFQLIEEKYNHRNWNERFGFYTSSEAKNGVYRQWQTGWVGGTINTYPGLALGCVETKEKSRKTLDFAFNHMQSPNGFLYGVFCDGKIYGDDFLDPHNKNIVMSRKNADALYYLVKQLLFLREQGETISPLWHCGLHRLANAFTAFYKKNGDIGQFIDIEGKDAYISGSASGGLVGAGLALCAVYFKNPSYLETAQDISKGYYKKYISKGLSTGGPGEILSCPDSESAFALLESFMTLYRCTEAGYWLQCSKDTAALCASWCVSYDYRYQKNTQFFERRVATTGAVWANVQNKHAAPGICTMSGESLLHLYRATGNSAYLELLKDIAHNLTQYLSTGESPIDDSYIWHKKSASFQKFLHRKIVKTVTALSHANPAINRLLIPMRKKLFNPVGRINERVNLSDWEGRNNVGEVPHGSCWCEVSEMLTYLEIPALYIQLDTGFYFAFDHIECIVLNKAAGKLSVELYNPTDYDAKYRLLIESAQSCGTPIPLEKPLKMKTVFLYAGERKVLQLDGGRGYAGN